MTSDDPETHTLINALRVAAYTYTQDASDMEKASLPRIAEQFRAQASQTYRLADNLEDGLRVLRLTEQL